MTGVLQFLHGLLLARQPTAARIGSAKTLLTVKGLIGLSMLGFTAWFFAPMLQADFWALDDHEIVRFLPDGRSRISLSEIPTVLREKTELGKSFASTRYRPTYYLLRISELYFWHVNARAWFMARFVMVLTSLCILGLVATRFLGTIVGTLIIALSLIPAYWGDTWGRTGPAEQYATLGIAVLIWGLSLVRPRYASPGEFRDKAAVTLICIGIFLTVGSKELFLPLCAIPALYLAWPALRRKLGVIGIAALAASFCYCAVIAVTLYAGIKQNGGKTAYGQQLGYDYLFKIFGRFLELAAPWLIGFALVMLASFLLISSSSTGFRIRNFILQASLAFFLGLLGLLWIVFFYAGAWPTYQYSYDFPGMLLVPYAVGLFYWILDRSLHMRPPPPRRSGHPGQCTEGYESGAQAGLPFLALLRLHFAPRRQILGQRPDPLPLRQRPAQDQVRAPARNRKKSRHLCHVAAGL